MDTETCKCGRETVSITGRCGTCIAEGAAMLRAFLDGTMTFEEFMTEIVK